MADRGLVVVGGGPAADSAAVAYRAAGGLGPVTVLSADADPPYERPPLSKDYLRGEAQDADIAIRANGFYTDRGIAVWLRAAVARLDPAAREVMLADGRVLGYDSCVLATGSTPRRLPVPGAGLGPVRLLRSLGEARALRAAAERARRAVVIGAGFIGCEAAASLARRGVAVTLISDEEAPQARRLGAEVGRRIAGWLREERVQTWFGDEVAEISPTGGGLDVRAASGRRADGDTVLMAVGVSPNAQLAQAAGLALGHGRVEVDERMRASAPGVFAAGDVAFARNAAAGRHLTVEHWGDALAMGEVAGTGAAGADASWAQAPGFWTTIGDRTLKYAAWGDGHDQTRLVEHGPDSFTVWYGCESRTVGVLTLNADDDYERGRRLVEAGAPLPA